MFLNQIIFIECVIKSNITIQKILSMFGLSLNNQEITQDTSTYNRTSRIPKR